MRPQLIFFVVIPLGLWLESGLGTNEARGQAALADDIILAAKAKQLAEKERDSTLGELPGAGAVPYSRRPGSTDIRLGNEGGRRPTSLPRLARRPAEDSALGSGEGGTESNHGLAPSFERLRIPGPFPVGGLIGPTGGPEAEIGEEMGPPDGPTLDQLMARLVQTNTELRIKSLEIPQAQADILTAGLLENPLLFYSSDKIPYGSYSQERPGDIEHGISLVYPLDLTGKRRARVALARREKSVLEAQYQNAVRLAIDRLYTLYVDVLAARHDYHTARTSHELMGQLVRATQAEGVSDEEEREQLDDLIIEYDVTTMAVGDGRERYEMAKQRLGHFVGMCAEDAAAMEIRGSIRVLAPLPPPLETLLGMAMACRPDLAAHHRGVARARAQIDFEWAERFSDVYFLYSPYGFTDNSYVGERSATAWGAGVFVSVPLFNRNQGNLQRAKINLDQSHLEADEMKSVVASEVQMAYLDFQHTYEDIQRLEKVTLPAIRRKRDRGWEKLRAGKVSPADVLILQRDSTFLVGYYHEVLIKHRRNSLRLNTAVGRRILP